MTLITALNRINCTSKTVKNLHCELYYLNCQLNLLDCCFLIASLHRCITLDRSFFIAMSYVNQSLSVTPLYYYTDEWTFKVQVHVLFANYELKTVRDHMTLPPLHSDIRCNVFRTGVAMASNTTPINVKISDNVWLMKICSLMQDVTTILRWRHIAISR